MLKDIHGQTIIDGEFEVLDLPEIPLFPDPIVIVVFYVPYSDEGEGGLSPLWPVSAPLAILLTGSIGLALMYLASIILR